MPRAIWTGSISFGLVNLPVRMYSAISEHKLHFHLVHERDQSPIGYQKVCKLEDKPVPDDEVVKAFEFEPGEYVFMEEEDFEAARAEAFRRSRSPTSCRTSRSIRSTSHVRTTSGRKRAARRLTACCCVRWRIPRWPESRSSSCATASTSGRSASATA